MTTSLAMRLALEARCCLGAMLLLLPSCSGSEAGGSEAGFENGPCIDGACMVGLECVDQVCVVPAHGSSDTSAGSTSNASDDGDTGTTSNSSSGADVTGPAETSEGTPSESGESTTGEMTDPNWPPPDDGTCSPGFIRVVHGDIVCAPPCAGWESRCPAPLTGNAEPICMYNEEPSSFDDCNSDDDCTVPFETCEVDPFRGVHGCRLPAVACELVCAFADHTECPDGMYCDLASFGHPTCLWPQ